jgi:fibronectin-binding autotransporter adhesin
MKKINAFLVIALVCLFGAIFVEATISPATVPHVIDSAATPKVSYVDDNDDALKDKLNEVVDTVNIYLNGGVSASILSSTGDQRLTIDSDNNGTHRWMVTNNGTSDTLIRILDTKAWKFYGDGTVTGKLSLSDSLLAAAISGTGLSLTSNASIGGTLGVTGASTLAALSATTGAFSSTLSVTGASTLAALSATTGAFSSTASVSSTLTLGAGIVMNNGQNIVIKNASSTNRNVLTIDASNNTELGGTVDGGIEFFVNAGNNGGTVSSAGAWSLPSTLLVTGAITNSALSSGRIPVVSTSGLITQDNIYWDATNDRIGIGSGASSPSAALAIIKSDAGSTVQATIYNSDNTNNSSNGRLVVASGGSSGGDAFTTYANQVIDWSMGLDNSDADAFVISEANALGTNNRLRIASGGAVSVPGTFSVSSTSGFGGAVTITSGGMNSVGKVTSTDTLGASLGLRVGSAGATDVNWNRASADRWTTPDSVTVAGRLDVTSRVISSDTVAAANGFRAGSAGATDVSLYRGGADLWQTPDALTVDGALTASQITLGGGEAFVYGDTSFTVTFTGVSGTVTGTAYATRIGKMINLDLPPLNGTSNASTATITGIPTGWRIARQSLMPGVSIVDNGTFYQNDIVNAISGAVMNTDGTITLSVAGNAAGFTSSGTKGFMGDGMFTSRYSFTYLAP